MIGTTVLLEINDTANTTTTTNEAGNNHRKQTLSLYFNDADDNEAARDAPNDGDSQDGYEEQWQGEVGERPGLRDIRFETKHLPFTRLPWQRVGVDVQDTEFAEVGFCGLDVLPGDAYEVVKHDHGVEIKYVALCWSRACNPRAGVLCHF